MSSSHQQSTVRLLENSPFWRTSIDSCQTGAPLTITWPYCGLRYWLTKFEFFWSYPLISYYCLNDCMLKFTLFNAYEIGSCVYEPHYWTFNFKLTSAKIQPAFTDREVGLTSLTMVTRWSCSDWSKFDRWVHAASWNLFNESSNWNIAARKILKLFVDGLFIGWEMRRLSKSSEIGFRMDRFYSLSLA